MLEIGEDIHVRSHTTMIGWYMSLIIYKPREMLSPSASRHNVHSYKLNHVHICTHDDLMFSEYMTSPIIVPTSTEPMKL